MELSHLHFVGAIPNVLPAFFVEVFAKQNWDAIKTYTESIWIWPTTSVCESVRPKKNQQSSIKGLFDESRTLGFKGLKRGCVTNFNMMTWIAKQSMETWPERYRDPWDFTGDLSFTSNPQGLMQQKTIPDHHSSLFLVKPLCFEPSHDQNQNGCHDIIPLLGVYPIS